MKRKHFYLIFLTFFCMVCSGPDSPAGKIPAFKTKEDLLKALKELQKKDGLKTASIGFYLKPISGSSNNSVSYNESLSLVPASTMKAISTATAIDILGADYKFKTQIEYSGVISGGVLKGNIYITGGGDPTLGKNNYKALFKEWASKIKAKGINKIDGGIIADARIFSHQVTPGSWAWEDLGNYYGAAAYGLNINDNTYELFFKPSTVGKKAKVLRTVPKQKDLTFINEMKTGKAGSGDNGYIYGGPYEQQRYLRGTIPAGVNEFKIKGAISDPPLFCAQELKSSLEAIGINSSKKATTCRIMIIDGDDVEESRKLIHTTYSLPLKDIIKKTNYHSINLYAEACIKMVGKIKRDKGNDYNGAVAIENYWKAKGVDISGMSIQDGSGLSRANSITAKQMADIMAKMQKTKGATDFWNSLPTSGVSGTLRSLNKSGTAYKRVHAKSGSFNRVRSYTGYIESTSGKKYAFAIIVNNYFCSYGQMSRNFEAIFNIAASLKLD